ELRLRAAVGDDRFDPGKGCADAAHLGLRLPAAAEDAQRGGAVTREMLRRNGARRARSQPAEVVGLDDSDELRTVRRKQRDDDRRALVESGVRFDARVPEPEV